MAVTGIALAENPALSLARTIKSVDALEQLTELTVGGGSIYCVEESNFVIVDLMHTSGIFTSEFFVYELVEDELKFRAHLPLKRNLTRDAKIADGLLVVHEGTRSDWNVALRLEPLSNMNSVDICAYEE